MQQFLWFLGGFDALLLRREECRSLRAKYSTIGGLVLMTGLLAMCSGGYAIYSVFDRLDVALALAALWGIFILCFDRYLITSTRKLATLKEFYATLQTTPPYYERHSWSSLAALAVRLLMAGAIGVVVAAPIEMAILKPWVVEHERGKDIDNSRRLRTESDVSAIDEDINRHEAIVEQRSRQTEEYRSLLRREVDGLGQSRELGFGPQAQQLKARLDEAEQKEKLERTEVDRLRATRAQELTRIEKERQGDLASQRQHESIISDLGAIHEIRKGGGTKADLVGTVTLFLTWFFVIIEITPILSKVVSPFDVYDGLLLEAEHGFILQSLTSARRAHAHAMQDMV